jgi:hypothetical protein
MVVGPAKRALSHDLVNRGASPPERLCYAHEDFVSRLTEDGRPPIKHIVARPPLSSMIGPESRTGSRPELLTAMQSAIDNSSLRAEREHREAEVERKREIERTEREWRGQAVQ